MAVNGSTESDLNALRDDFAAFRRDITGLIGNLTQDASNGAGRAAGMVQDKASEAYRTVAGKSDQAVMAIGKQVEAQPIVALLIALGIGYLSGRVLTR